MRAPLELVSARLAPGNTYNSGTPSVLLAALLGAATNSSEIVCADERLAC